jgi:DNA (cytosine-5)-methyltransferase 1
MPRKPIALDLFCGAGGLTTGLKQAGFRVIGAVDCDALAVETYKSNRRAAVVWERDVRKLPVAEVMRTLDLEPGDLDLLAGCPPCEGFSAIRTRNGGVRVRDKKNDLVLEFIRFARRLRPKTIMIENDPALASNRRLRRLKAELRRLGYTFDVRILNVAEYGVPQRRRRMVLLSSRFGSVPFPNASNG